MSVVGQRSWHGGSSFGAGRTGSRAAGYPYAGREPRLRPWCTAASGGPAAQQGEPRSVRSKIGSQSNQRRPARELRSLRRQGAFRARAGLSSARMPMALTILPPKRGLALR